MQYKSACLHVSFLDDNGWTATQAEDMDNLLRSRIGILDTPKKKRGQLTYEKLAQVELLARGSFFQGGDEVRKDVIEGLYVLYGACCRGQDIAALNSLRVTELHKPVPILWAWRKATATTRVLRGEFTPNPVCLERAIAILRTRVAKAGDDEDLLFPAWSFREVTRVIKETAVLHNWPDKVVWSGAHNGRNGSAKDVFDQALAQVQAAGVWDRLESSEIYGGPRQACDTAQDFRAFLAAQNAGLAERLRAAGLQGAVPRSLPPAVRNTAAAELTAPGPSPKVNPTTSRRAKPKEDARKKKAKASQAAPAAKKKKPVKR